MNGKECYPVEALADVDGWAADDPRRRHLADCPRCRARLAEYRSFVAAVAPSGADPDDADRRLTAFLVRAAAGEAGLSAAGRADGPTPGPAAGPAVSPEVRLPARRPRRPLRVPFWRPTLAAAAVVVGLLGIWRAVDTGWQGGGERVLRGESPAPAAAPILQPVSALPDGRWQLAWSAVEGADGYTVVLHAADLTEVARLEAGTWTTLALARPPAASSPPGRAPSLWRVVARRGGDTLASSALAALEPAR